MATYPANLCPLLFGGEFAKFGSDFGEPIDQPIEDARRSIDGVGKRAPEHFEDMLSDLDSLKGAGVDRPGPRWSSRFWAAAGDAGAGSERRETRVVGRSE